MRTRYSYKVGGSLPANDPTYVTRQADAALLQAIQQGRFCHVLGPRQVGKSSLRIQTRHRLQGLGYRCASVQVTDISFSSSLVEPVQKPVKKPAKSTSSWDKQLIALIWDSLHPDASATLSQWLEATARLSSQQRLEHFARDLLFPELREQPLVVFMDEIDYLLESPEAAYDLINWIAKCYNLRDNHGEYQSLSFVTLGNTSLAALAKQAFDSPHLQPHQDTIACEITACEILLDSFTLSEMKPLRQGFAHSQFNSPSAALRCIYKWTSGQPFLTQKLCQIVTSQAKILSAATLRQLSATKLDIWIDQIVHRNILHNWADQDDPVHLRSIRDRLNQSPRRQSLYRLYHQISTGMRIPCSGNALQAELLITGLVRCEHQHLRCANKIYQHVFAQPLQEKINSPPSFLFCSHDAMTSAVNSFSILSLS
jgi:AAA-like domain